MHLAKWIARRHTHIHSSFAPRNASACLRLLCAIVMLAPWLLASAHATKRIQNTYCDFDRASGKTPHTHWNTTQSIDILSIIIRRRHLYFRLSAARRSRAQSHKDLTSAQPLSTKLHNSRYSIQFYSLNDHQRQKSPYRDYHGLMRCVPERHMCCVYQ